MNKENQYTYVMIKPDVSNDFYTVRIIRRIFEKNGMEVVASYESEKNPMGYFILDDKIIEEHYSHVKKYGMNIYNSVVSYMKSGYVIPMILYGEDAINSVRKIIGSTDSTKAEKNTIRGMFGTDKQNNAIHASDSLESAKEEIARFFNGMTIEDLENLKEHHKQKNR